MTSQLFLLQSTQEDCVYLFYKSCSHLSLHTRQTNPSASLAPSWTTRETEVRLKKDGLANSQVGMVNKHEAQMKGLVLCNTCGWAPEVNSNNKLPPHPSKMHPSCSFPSSARRLQKPSCRQKPDCFVPEMDFPTNQLLVHAIIAVITPASSNIAATYTTCKLRCNGKVSHGLFARVWQFVIVTWLQMISPPSVCIERSQFKQRCTEKNDPLNVAGNYCDYSGAYDGGALQRTVLSWGLAGIEAARY